MDIMLLTQSTPQSHHHSLALAKMFDTSRTMICNPESQGQVAIFAQEQKRELPQGAKWIHNTRWTL